MILELLGLGMLGAIGKTVYDEAKKEQSSNNTNQSTPNKNYTDDSRYWNLIYSYARKYQYRKTEIPYDILHEIQLKTNRDLLQIKCDYEKALNKINKKAEKAKTASMKSTSSNKNTTVQSEPKHNNRNQSTASNNTKSDWEPNFVDLYEDIPSLSAKPYLTSNFYISSYICPTCKNNMYKTVFRIGGEPIIKTSTIPITMKRLFTCPNCKTFYTPLPGQKLSQGMVYCKKCSSDYDTLLREYDYIGTTQGRPDA